MTTTSEIEKRAEQATSGAPALGVVESFPPEIVDGEQYTFVTEQCQGLRALDRKIESDFREVKSDARALWQKMVDWEKREREAPQRGLALGKSLLDDFDERQRKARVEVERLAREERERVEREAREAAERLETLAREERETVERLEREAREAREEAERLQAEEPGDAEDELKRQEAIDVSEEDQRNRLAAIADADKKAKALENEAERTLTAPRPATSFAAPVEEAPAVSGATKSERLDFEIVKPGKIKVTVLRDAMSLVAAEKLKSSWLGQHLKKVVKAHGENAGTVVGEGALEFKTKTVRSFK